jgi:hypothetical protein
MRYLIKCTIIYTSNNKLQKWEEGACKERGEEPAIFYKAQKLL